jgi:hypothetical protein
MGLDRRLDLCHKLGCNKYKRLLNFLKVAMLLQTDNLLSCGKVRDAGRLFWYMGKVDDLCTLHHSHRFDKWAYKDWFRQITILRKPLALPAVGCVSCT